MNASDPLLDKHGNPFVLRAYEPGDRRALEAMYDAFEPKRAAQGLPPDDAGRRRAWIESLLDSGLHLLVEVDGRVRGHGMLLPFDEGAVELANFLHQSIRDRGIGTALNCALVEAGWAAGYRRIWLSVEPSNRRAIRSYEKVGFRRRPTTGWAPELEMEALLVEDGDEGR